MVPDVRRGSAAGPGIAGLAASGVVNYAERGEDLRPESPRQINRPRLGPSRMRSTGSSSYRDAATT
jgi:hypothetical protein